MDFGFTEEHKLLQRNVRDFAKKEIGPSAARIDRDEEFPWDNFRKMGELGLMGVSIDPQYGGSGGGYIDISIVVEELARVCAATSLIYIASVSLASKCIEAFGSHEQKNAYLRPLARGQRLGAFALSEPNAVVTSPHYAPPPQHTGANISSTAARPSSPTETWLTSLLCLPPRT